MFDHFQQLQTTLFLKAIYSYVRFSMPQEVDQGKKKCPENKSIRFYAGHNRLKAYCDRRCALRKS